MSWSNINEYVLLKIYELLGTSDIENAGKVCRRWRNISQDDLLWKKIVINTFYDTSPGFKSILKPENGFSPSPGTSSWARKDQ